MERLSLEQRFRMAESQNPDFLAIFDMNLSMYLSVLTELNANADYDNLIEKLRECFKDYNDSYLAHLIISTEALIASEQEYILSEILVKPFTLIKDKELEK